MLNRVYVRVLVTGLGAVRSRGIDVRARRHRRSKRRASCQRGIGLSTPGSMSSLLGPMPGSSGMTFGMQPGRDDMILGRVGLGAPRVPTSITTPGGVYQGPRRTRGNRGAAAVPVPPPLLYGTMELPDERG